MVHFLLLVSIFVFTGCEPRLATDSQLADEQDRQISASPSPAATPVPFTRYKAPEVELQEVYEVAMLGDSMMESLGPHGGSFTEKLNRQLEGRDVLVDNYALGSTNILTIDERLKLPTTTGEWTYEPILERPELDLIIIDSFAYNPLSHITDRAEALGRQNQALTDMLTQITNRLPKTRVVFLATIAPNMEAFSKTQGLKPEERVVQAQERIEYLENHIAYARDHDIPLIDVYHLSLLPSGGGSLEYINPGDFIHPSGTGVELISQTAADFIVEYQILPN